MQSALATAALRDNMMTEVYRLVKASRSAEEMSLLVVENAQTLGDAKAFLPREYEKYEKMARDKEGEFKLDELNPLDAG